MTTNQYEIYINDNFITKRKTKNEYKFFNVTVTEYLIVKFDSDERGQTFQQCSHSFSSNFNPKAMDKEITYIDQKKLEKHKNWREQPSARQRAILENCTSVYAKANRVFSKSYPIVNGKNNFTETDQLYLEGSSK